MSADSAGARRDCGLAVDAGGDNVPLQGEGAPQNPVLALADPPDPCSPPVSSVVEAGQGVGGWRGQGGCRVGKGVRKHPPLLEQWLAQLRVSPGHRRPVLQRSKLRALVQQYGPPPHDRPRPRRPFALSSTTIRRAADLTCGCRGKDSECRPSDRKGPSRRARRGAMTRSEHGRRGRQVPELELPNLTCLTLSEGGTRAGASAGVGTNGRTCWQQARSPDHDLVTMDELAAYLDCFLHLPRKMSQMAEMMYT